MSFISLLIHRCDIQSKSASVSGYEKVDSWSSFATDVLCRHDSDTSPKIQDGVTRENNDDDIFFFPADTTIARGNRILHEGLYYDVLKVNKLYDSEALHHLEVKARQVDDK